MIGMTMKVSTAGSSRTRSPNNMPVKSGEQAGKTPGDGLDLADRRAEHCGELTILGERAHHQSKPRLRKKDAHAHGDDDASGQRQQTRG
jgi:hypothetical protein